MKVRAIVNGEIRDLEEETANALIEAGIYEAVEPEPPTKPDEPSSARRRPRP